MAKNDTTIEVIAPTVEEAVDKGLSELGLSKEDVDIKILDEGKHNIFRFATRQARVRLTVHSNQIQNEEHIGDDVFLDEDQETFSVEEFEVEQTEWFDLEEQEIQSDTETVVSKTVEDILRKMSVKAEVKVSTIDSPEDEKPIISVNIEGDDLSFLIGRKSETLNALQYITSLIVNRKLNDWIPIQIDVQNYRARRENELKKLARRMAEQVKASGRKQYLEPMPANERRIIHIALRDNPNVRTESEGEEPNRKVCIIPVK